MIVLGASSKRLMRVNTQETASKNRLEKMSERFLGFSAKQRATSKNGSRANATIERGLQLAKSYNVVASSLITQRACSNHRARTHKIFLMVLWTFVKPAKCQTRQSRARHEGNRSNTTAPPPHPLHSWFSSASHPYQEVICAPGPSSRTQRECQQQLYIAAA